MKIMNVTNFDGDVLARVRCDRMVQRSSGACIPIVTRAGAVKIDKLLETQTIYNEDGRYKPRIIRCTLGNTMD